MVVPLLLAAALSPAARAQDERTVSLGYYNTTDGRGELAASVSPDTWGTPTWTQCPPGGGPCQPFGHDGELVISVGDAQPGTVFEVTVSGSGSTASARSDPYGGRLRVVRGPGVKGSLRVGSLVKPAAAQWDGGWGGEPPFLQLQVCRTKRGRGCRVVSSTFYWERCPGAGALLTARDAGLFLRVADMRYARLPIFPNFAVTRPGQLTPLSAAGNTATTIRGPIRAGRAARTNPCRST